MDKMKLIRLSIFILFLIIVVGCTSEGNVPPPSGPIGGGC